MCGWVEPANGSPVRTYRSRAARVALPMSKQVPVHEYSPCCHHLTKRSIRSRPSSVTVAARLSASASAMAVSSVQAPGGSANGPPPVMSSRRGCASREWNSSVVPTASPMARPRKAPSARSRTAAAVCGGTDGGRAAQRVTWASCDAVSMACGDRASRTRRIASSGDAPSSTSRRAATVPARPRPPRQWTSTSKPRVSRSRMASPAISHASSKSGPGGHPSGIGACHHSMCLSRTASGRPRTDRKSSSSSVTRLTTAVAPQR